MTSAVFRTGLLLLFAVSGCSTRGPSSDPSFEQVSDRMLSGLGEPLIFVRQLDGLSAAAVESLALVPVQADGATDGGYRLWVACGNTLDGGYAGIPECALPSLTVVADDSEYAFGDLDWQPYAPVALAPGGVRLSVAATVTVDKVVLERLRGAEQLALVLPRTAQGAYRLARDGRRNWGLEDAGSDLRFRARVGLPSRD
ncbi:MAG: hypothetical protein AAF648_04335 [Pseudomonadota bacterium]